VVWLFLPKNSPIDKTWHIQSHLVLKKLILPRTIPKKLNYQWSFSYLTGFTGSAGFSFLFLSFLLPAIASPGRLALLGRRAGSSEAGGEETEKDAPVK